MVGIFKSLDFPGSRRVSGSELLRDIDAETGTEGLASDLADAGCIPSTGTMIGNGKVLKSVGH